MNVGDGCYSKRELDTLLWKKLWTGLLHMHHESHIQNSAGLTSGAVTQAALSLKKKRFLFIFLNDVSVKKKSFLFKTRK